MKATIVDLRYKTKEILQALKRKEIVQIQYHGKDAGTIYPPSSQPEPVEKHPLFGFRKDETESVEQKLARLRQPRY
jgi:hypothetical protein